MIAEAAKGNVAGDVILPAQVAGDHKPRPAARAACSVSRNSG